MDRTDISARYRKEFDTYEKWVLGMKQPWLYESLAVAYNICAMLENEYVHISDYILNGIKDLKLRELVEEVINYMSERDDCNLDMITIDALTNAFGE